MRRERLTPLVEGATRVRNVDKLWVSGALQSARYFCLTPVIFTVSFVNEKLIPE